MNDHIPLTERDHVLIDVKAKPSGGLRPALTPTPGAALRATSGTPANRRSTISGLYGFRGLPKAHRRRLPPLAPAGTSTTNTNPTAISASTTDPTRPTSTFS